MLMCKLLNRKSPPSVHTHPFHWTTATPSITLCKAENRQRYINCARKLCASVPETTIKSTKWAVKM